ncbi:TorF family putative porin [Massilia sp. SM-13]|uniref:TorF family putative porin n=1 Tax=Pseudoduganella rhizocola TaxID=3382643 RepID=UPI0038B69CF8
MKHLILATAISAVFAAHAHAGDFSLNAAAVSDYRYRGISQTRLQSALQGGADWVDSGSGLYVGVWASTIKWTKDAGGGGSTEWDIYAGKRGDIAEGVSYDVGVLGYAYPSNGLNPSANTLELYGQIGSGPFTLKYSHSTTNLFGFADSRHSGYIDGTFSKEIGEGYGVSLHAGHQQVKHNSKASYSDWKAGISKDFGVATVTLAYVGTNADRNAYASPANGKFTGRNALQLMVAKTF